MHQQEGYTTIKRKDGTVVKLKGANLSPEEVELKMAAFDAERVQPLPAAPVPRKGMLQRINESLAPSQFTEKGEPTTAGGEIFGKVEEVTGSPLYAELARRTADINPLANPRETLKALGRGAMMLPNMAAAALAPAETPEEKAITMSGFNPLAGSQIAMKRLVLDPMQRGAEEVMSDRDIGTRVRGGFRALVPIAGEIGASIGEQEEKVGLGPALTEQAAAVAAPIAAVRVAGAIKQGAAARNLPTPRRVLQKALGVERPKTEVTVLDPAVAGIKDAARPAIETQLRKPVSDAFGPLEQFVDTNTRPYMSTEIMDDMIQSYSAKGLNVPDEIRAKVVSIIEKNAGMTGRVPFSKLRDIRSQVSGVADSLRGPEAAALYQLADMIEGRALQLADTAGVRPNYMQLKEGWKEQMADLQAADALLEADSLNRTVDALRSPKVTATLQKYGVDTKLFDDLQFAGFTEPKVPGFNLDEVLAESMKRPEGGPTGMRALALERAATVKNPVREAGELATPIGRARMGAGLIGRIPPIRSFVAGPAEPFTPAAPRAPFQALPLPPSTQTQAPPARAIPPPRNLPPPQSQALAPIQQQPQAPVQAAPQAPVISSGIAFRIADIERAIKSLESQKPASRAVLKREFGPEWESIPAKELRSRLQGKLDELKAGGTATPQRSALKPSEPKPEAKVVEQPKPQAKASKTPGTSQYQDAQIAGKQRGMLAHGRKLDSQAQTSFGKPYSKLTSEEKSQVRLALKPVEESNVKFETSDGKVGVVDDKGKFSVKPKSEAAPQDISSLARDVTEGRVSREDAAKIAFKQGQQEAAKKFGALPKPEVKPISTTLTKGDKVRYTSVAGQKGKGEVVRVYTDSKGRELVEIYDEGSRTAFLKDVRPK